jgi:hypothetical protein
MLRLSLAIFLLFTPPAFAGCDPPDVSGPCCTQGSSTRLYWVQLSNGEVLWVSAGSDRDAWDVVETHLWQIASIESILSITPA